MMKNLLLFLIWASAYTTGLVVDGLLIANRRSNTFLPILVGVTVFMVATCFRDRIGRKEGCEDDNKKNAK
jgi:hypothetical protein